MTLQEDTGFPISKAQAIAYSTWVADEVHSRGMNVGLKNAIDHIPEVEDKFDWFLNEQCNGAQHCHDRASLHMPVWT